MLPSPSHRLKRLKRRVLAKLALLSPRLDLLGAPSPFVKLEYAGRMSTRTLFIFLPGIDDLAEDFEHHGFIDEMRRHDVHVDAVAIDAHFGYYARRVIHDRITEDLIDAARGAGYRDIWLIGISLGGFGAASYAARHGEALSGLLLIAPYLGERKLVTEIVTAGGVAAWNPGAVHETDYPRHLWGWLRQHVAGSSPGPELHLAFGRSDRFVHAHEVLGHALPHSHVHAADGGHDWRTWKRLWRQFLLQRWSGHESNQTAASAQQGGRRDVGEATGSDG